MDQKPKQNPNKYQNQVEAEHFLPGQVVLHLTHPTEVSKQQIATELRKFIRSNSLDLEPPGQEKFLTFPARNEKDTAFSIVRTSMQEPEASKDQLVKLLVEIHRYLDAPISSDGTITLKSVSPNWLISSGNHQAGTAGPGGWPKQAPRKNVAPKFQFSDINEIKLEEAQWGTGVTVAILDTAPCLHDMIDAYNYWHDHEKETSNHELVEELLKPGNCLTVHRMTEEDLISTMDFSALRHRYRMADHGLFVAGIIHTIAPQASLHLYEALNQYGIGSLETIAQSLLQVLDLLATLRNAEKPQPLIVNCSLMLGASGDDPNLPEQLSNTGLFKDMTKSFEQIIAQLDQDDVVVVAAAGNDAQREQKPDSTGQPEESVPAGRPPARYPAAFKQVIGVGALPREHPPRGQRHKAASYSNLADRPETTGYATFGGEPRAKNGVLGVYIGGFPRIKSNIDKNEQAKNILPKEIEYVRNESGWAWWAGTSFAAPIISGLLAAWWSEHRSEKKDRAEEFLTNTAKDNTTEQSEKVIRVEQVMT